MRIAITGHRDLYWHTAALVDAALRHEVRRLGDGRSLVRIACLADGADTMFAEAVLDAGGAIEVVRRQRG